MSITPINFDFGGIRLNSVQITIFAIAVLLMFVLHLFVKRTKMGKAMRATAESPTTAALLGISVNPGDRRHLHDCVGAGGSVGCAGGTEL